jgi:hypothetical protein
MSDSADLAQSPLRLPFALQGPLLFDEYLFFGQPLTNGNHSYVELIFPFGFFPGAYSGGPLCTNVIAYVCGAISGAGIGPSDQSSNLLATTTTGGGGGDTIIITSGSVTPAPMTQAPEPSAFLLLCTGLLLFVPVCLRRRTAA